MIRALALAIRALHHSILTNVLGAVTLAAVLTPLLVLYGLKLGVIEGLLDKLRADPSILAVSVSGYRTISEAELAAIRAWPETGFAAGAPRSIVASAEMRPSPQSREYVDADWLPSAAGEPLLPAGAPPLGDNDIALSEPLAEKLGAKVGDMVQAAIYRDGSAHELTMDMRVAAVLPRAALGGSRALVSEGRLVTMARFSDGLDEGQASATAPRTFDSLRLYARDLDAVAPLERRIAQRGFRTGSAAENIAWVRNLEAIMTGIFAIVCVGGIVGYLVSLWAMIQATVRQARPSLALLRLMGMPGRALLAFPLVQAVAVTAAGIAGALLLAGAAAFALNHFYRIEGTSGDICRLEPASLAIVAAASLITALLVALTQTFQIRSIVPSEALAESLA
ncbi:MULTISPECIES: hypothetical protein [unclassified Xanthobacter]|uniref:hypothetical protein n=1 Tax=unclassified Xanthobacter TaxID=2623496 RepID=UPI001F48A6C7|nr:MULTISPECIES: hypothetical protein [unclassified Xanthobacter]